MQQNNLDLMEWMLQWAKLDQKLARTVARGVARKRQPYEVRECLELLCFQRLCLLENTNARNRTS